MVPVYGGLLGESGPRGGVSNVWNKMSTSITYHQLYELGSFIQRFMIFAEMQVSRGK